MSLRLDEFLADFEDEVGTELFGMTSAGEVTRWLNQGQRRLGWKKDAEATLTWAAGDTEVDLPADCYKPQSLIANSDTTVPPYKFRQTSIRFLVDEDGADDAGTAKLDYLANYSAITDTAASELSSDGDDACLAYALYRFFRKLATSRSNYQRYAVTQGINAISVDDLVNVMNQHLDEFLSVQQDDPPGEVSTFYGG